MAGPRSHLRRCSHLLRCSKRFELSDKQRCAPKQRTHSSSSRQALTTSPNKQLAARLQKVSQTVTGLSRCAQTIRNPPTSRHDQLTLKESPFAPLKGQTACQEHIYTQHRSTQYSYRLRTHFRSPEVLPQCTLLSIRARAQNWLLHWWLSVTFELLTHCPVCPALHSDNTFCSLCSLH